MPFDELYLAFLIYFNRDRDYFECHEVMEELWLSKGNDPLYKGLLQVAVGLFHVRDGNIAGSLKMMSSAAAKLAAYPPDSLGINLGKLRDEVEQYIDKLSQYEDHPFTYYDLTIDITDPRLAEAVLQTSPQVTKNIPIQLKRQRGPKHELREQNKNYGQK